MRAPFQRTSMRTMFVLLVIVSCTRAKRGEPCKNDSDCEKQMKCVELQIAGNAFCTTSCSMVAGDCPSGWKCMDVSRFTDLHDYACVRQ